MTTESKRARYLALANASEFIRSHGEEGGIDEDNFPVDVDIYLREAKRVANMLDKMAHNYNLKWHLLADTTSARVNSNQF